jgi:hypothetical protein
LHLAHHKLVKQSRPARAIGHRAARLSFGIAEINGV